MSLIARDFITVVYPEVSGAIPIMQLLCVAGGFVAVGYASGDLFTAMGKPRLGLYFSLMFVPILIGGFLLFVDRGVIAIAAVHVAVIIPYSVFRIEVANRLLGTTWRQSLAALRPAARARRRHRRVRAAGAADARRRLAVAVRRVRRRALGRRRSASPSATGRCSPRSRGRQGRPDPRSA